MLSLLCRREMVAITVLTSVVVHLVLVRCFPKRFYAYEVSSSSAEVSR